MAPVHLLGIFVVEIGAVVDQRVHTLQKLDELLAVRLLRPAVAKFVVRHVGEGVAAMVDAVRQAAAGMLQQHGRHLHAVEAISALGHVLDAHQGEKLLPGDGKEGAVQLVVDEIAQAPLALGRPVDDDVVVGEEQRVEEGQAVEVVQIGRASCRERV